MLPSRSCLRAAPAEAPADEAAAAEEAITPERDYPLDTGSGSALAIPCPHRVKLRRSLLQQMEAAVCSPTRCQLLAEHLLEQMNLLQKSLLLPPANPAPFPPLSLVAAAAWLHQRATAGKRLRQSQRGQLLLA